MLHIDETLPYFAISYFRYSKLLICARILVVVVCLKCFFFIQNYSTEIEDFRNLIYFQMFDVQNVMYRQMKRTKIT